MDCFLCTGVGLHITDDPTLRRLTLRGKTEDGRQTESSGLISTEHINDILGRINPAGRWVCIATDEQDCIIRLAYSEETAIPDQPPPDEDWKPLFGEG